MRRMGAALFAALSAARERPQHLVLAAVVSGLLAGTAPAWVALALVPAFVALAGRPGLGALAAAALLLASAGAQARLAALDAGHLAGMRGRVIATRAVLLEPLRERAAGPAVTRARLLTGAAAGDQAVLRLRDPGFVAAGEPTGSALPEAALAPAPAAATPAAASGRAPASARRVARGAGAAPEVGDVLDVIGRVEPLGRYDAYQRRRGAHGALTVFRVADRRARRGGVAGALDSVRRRAEAGLDRTLAPPEAALLRGMVLGEDERLGRDVRDDFRRSGLAHILAVSGQNVMLLATLALALGTALGAPLRARLGAALALVALYVPLAGGGPSIERAGVMGAASLVAALAGRPVHRWYALGLAAATTLALNPRSSGEPGWQLSFAAVIALLLLAPALRKRLARRLPGPLAEATAITLAATIGTAPLMAARFGQISAASLPANLVAGPAVAPIMWLGMLAVAAAQVSPALAAPFTALAGPLLTFVAGVAHAAARPTGATLPVRLASPVAVAGAYAMLAIATWAALRRWSPARAPAVGTRTMRRRLAACAGAALVAGVAALPGRGAAAPRPGELLVSFLDVGQGDATLLQRDGAAVLVDTGPPDGPILRRLAEAGVKRLDALVLTHAQADHEGAAPAVLRAVPTRLVLDGGAGWPTAVQAALRSMRTRIVPAHAGEVLTLGGLRLRVLWPPRGAFTTDEDPNQRAIVAIAQSGRFRLLLPADAESDITAPLELPRVDALKVAHHGSADPGLPGLLARLRPALAAIEVGRHNTYGHPAPATLAALRGVPTLVRTDRDGTVRLHVAGDRMTVERGAR